LSEPTEELTEGLSTVAVRRTTTLVSNKQWRKSWRRMRGYVEAEQHCGYGSSPGVSTS
jgi:hypothetical protein